MQKTFFRYCSSCLSTYKVVQNRKNTLSKHFVTTYFPVEKLFLPHGFEKVLPEVLSLLPLLGTPLE